MIGGRGTLQIIFDIWLFKKLGWKWSLALVPLSILIMFIVVKG
jgi:hypothetical protein